MWWWATHRSCTCAAPCSQGTTRPCISHNRSACIAYSLSLMRWAWPRTMESMWVGEIVLQSHNRPWRVFFSFYRRRGLWHRLKIVLRYLCSLRTKLLLSMLLDRLRRSSRLMYHMRLRRNHSTEGWRISSASLIDSSLPAWSSFHQGRFGKCDYYWWIMRSRFLLIWGG